MCIMQQNHGTGSLPQPSYTRADPGVFPRFPEIVQIISSWDFQVCWGRFMLGLSVID